MKDVIKYGLPWAILILIVAGFNQLEWNLNGQTMAILFALVAAYYFNLENPHKSYKYSVILSLAVWVATLQLRKEFHQEIGNWIPALAAAALAFVYFQRFKAREDKHWVDVLKLLGVISFLPATYFEPALTGIITIFLAFIYLLDRLIIRRQMNKTTQVIIFCVMGLISISFLVFAFIKADEAQKGFEMARAAQKEAERAQGEARIVQLKAQEETKKQAALAASIMEELQKCKSEKSN